MESVLGRYKNFIVLGAVLIAQVLGLAVQVRRTTDSESSRLIRVWAVGMVTPLEKALIWVQTSTGNLWHNYFYLRGVRAENRELRGQIERMRLEQVRLSQDADQARRLQALLAFKEQFISRTMAAQVIGSSGSEQSRSVYIDKGERDGIQPDMAVITADGVVGKVLRVYRSTALVLLIDDPTSGVGAILEKSRVQGILRGSPAGDVVLEKVMSDENVAPGELVVTSGGDRIFPKGLPVGRVVKASPGSDLFLNIRVKPAANLSKLEEVLVVTKIDERQAAPDTTGPVRAVDILAERLPGVPQKPAEAAPPGAPGVAPSTAGSKPNQVTSGAPGGGATQAKIPSPAAPKTANPTSGGSPTATTLPAGSATTTGNPPMKVAQKIAKPVEGMESSDTGVAPAKPATSKNQTGITAPEGPAPTGDKPETTTAPAKPKPASTAQDAPQ